MKVFQYFDRGEIKLPPIKEANQGRDVLEEKLRVAIAILVARLFVVMTQR